MKSVAQPTCAENYVSQRGKLCTQSISRNASPPTKFGIRNAPLSLFLSLYLSPRIYPHTHTHTHSEKAGSFSKSFLEIYRLIAARSVRVTAVSFDSIRNSDKELWAKSIRIVDSSRLTHILPEREKKRKRRRQPLYLLPRNACKRSRGFKPVVPSSKEFSFPRFEI